MAALLEPKYLAGDSKEGITPQFHPLSSLCFFWPETNMFGNWGEGPMNVFLQSSLGAPSGEEESEQWLRRGG